jgi:hypothetical protein
MRDWGQDTVHRFFGQSTTIQRIELHSNVVLSKFLKVLTHKAEGYEHPESCFFSWPSITPFWCSTIRSGCFPSVCLALFWSMLVHIRLNLIYLVHRGHMEAGGGVHFRIKRGEGEVCYNCYNKDIHWHPRHPVW